MFSSLSPAFLASLFLISSSFHHSIILLFLIVGVGKEKPITILLQGDPDEEDLVDVHCVTEDHDRPVHD